MHLISPTGAFVSCSDERGAELLLDGFTELPVADPLTGDTAPKTKPRTRKATK